MQEPGQNPQESLAEKARRRAREARSARPGPAQGQQVAPSAPGTSAPGQASGWQTPYATGGYTPVLTGQEGIAGPTHPWTDVAASAVDALSFGMVPHDSAWQWMASMGSAPTDPINTPEYWAAVHERLSRAGGRTKTQEVLSTAAWVAAAALPFLGEAAALRAMGATGRGGRLIREGKALMRSADVAERAKGAQMYAEGLSASNTLRRVMMGQTAPGAGGMATMGTEAAHTAALLTIDTGLRTLTNRLTPLNALTPAEEGYLRANPHTTVKGRKYDPQTGTVRWVNSDGVFSDNPLAAAAEAALLDGASSTALLSIGGAALSRVFGIGRNWSLQGAESELRSKFMRDAERTVAQRRAAGEVIDRGAVEAAWEQYQQNPVYASLVMDMASKSKAYRLGTDVAQPLILGAALHQLHEPDAGWGESIMVGGLSFMLGHLGSKKITEKIFKAHRVEQEELAQYADTLKEVERLFHEAAQGIRGEPATPVKAAEAKSAAEQAAAVAKGETSAQGAEAVVSDQTGAGKTPEKALPVEAAASGVKVSDANAFARAFAEKLKGAKTEEEVKNLVNAIDPALRPIAEKVVEESKVLQQSMDAAVKELAEPGKESEVPAAAAAAIAQEKRDEITQDRKIEAFERVEKQANDAEQAGKSAYIAAKGAAGKRIRERRKGGFGAEQEVSGRRDQKETGKVARNRYVPVGEKQSQSAEEAVVLAEAAATTYSKDGAIRVSNRVGQILNTALQLDTGILKAEALEKTPASVKAKLKAAREATAPYRAERAAQIRALRRVLTRDEEKALREKHKGALMKQKEARKLFGEAQQAMLSGDNLHTRAEKDFLNKLIGVVRDAAQKGTGEKKPAALGRNSGIAIGRAATAGFRTVVGKEGKDMVERKSALVNLAIAPEHAELLGMKGANVIPVEMTEAQAAYAGMGAVAKDRPVALVYSISPAGEVIIHSPKGVALIGTLWKENPRRVLKEIRDVITDEELESIKFTPEQQNLVANYIDNGVSDTGWREASKDLVNVVTAKSVKVTSGLPEDKKVEIAKAIDSVRKGGGAKVESRLTIEDIDLSADHNDVVITFSRKMRVKDGAKEVEIPLERSAKRYIPMPPDVLGRVLSVGSAGVARKRGKQAARYTVEAETALVERVNDLTKAFNRLAEEARTYGFYDELKEIASRGGVAREVLEEELRLSVPHGSRQGETITKFLDVDSELSAAETRLEVLRSAPDVAAELPEAEPAFESYALPIAAEDRQKLAERGAIADLLRNAGAFKTENDTKSKGGQTAIEAEMRGQYAPQSGRGPKMSSGERAIRAGVARSAVDEFMTELQAARVRGDGKDALIKFAESGMASMLERSGAMSFVDTAEGRRLQVSLYVNSRGFAQNYKDKVDFGGTRAATLEISGGRATFSMLAEEGRSLVEQGNEVMPKILEAYRKTLYDENEVMPEFGAPGALVADIGRTISSTARSKSKEAAWGYGTQYSDLRSTVSILDDVGDVIVDAGVAKGTSKFLSMLEQAASVLNGIKATSEIRLAELLQQKYAGKPALVHLYESLKETGDMPEGLGLKKFGEMMEQVLGDSRLGRGARVAVRLRVIANIQEVADKMEASYRDRLDALSTGITKIQKSPELAKEAINQGRLVSLRQEFDKVAQEYEALKSSKKAIADQQARMDLVVKAVLRLLGREEGGDVQKRIAQAVSPEKQDWVQWLAAKRASVAPPGEAATAAAARLATGHSEDQGVEATPGLHREAREDLKRSLAGKEPPSLEAKKKNELTDVSPETEALVPPLRGGLTAGEAGSSTRKAMDLFARNLNRVALERLEVEGESLSMADRIKHAYTVKEDAPLAVLQRLVNASGGITPNVGGNKGAAFGVSAENALSALRTIVGVDEAGRARGGRGARQSFRSDLRMSKEVAAKLGIWSGMGKEDIAALGLVSKRGELYVRGSEWGLRGDSALAAFKKAAHWIAEQSKLSALQQDALDVTRLLMDTELEGQLPKEVLSLLLPSDPATLMERHGRTSLVEVTSGKWAISSDMLGLGEGEIPATTLRRLGRHTSSQKRYYPPAIVTLASLRRAARLGALHAQTEVVLRGGEKSTMSMLDAAAYKIAVGGLRALKKSEADGMHWGRVIAEYVAGTGADLGELRENYKKIREDARAIIESGVTEAGLSAPEDLDTTKDVRRSSLWRVGKDSIEDVVALAQELGDRYSPEDLSRLIRMAARPGSGNAAELKARAMEVLGEPGAQILEIHGETPLEGLAVVLRSRIAADALRSVMLARQVLHVAGTSAAFSAGMAGRPLRLVDVSQGRESVIDNLAAKVEPVHSEVPAEAMEAVKDSYEGGVTALSALMETSPAVYEVAVKAIEGTEAGLRENSVAGYLDEAFFHAWAPEAAARLAEAVGITGEEAIAAVKMWQMKSGIHLESSGKSMRSLAKEYIEEPLKELGIEVNATEFRAAVARLIPGDASKAAGVYKHVQRMAATSPATGEGPIDRLVATMRAGKPLSELSQKHWSELKELGVVRESRGERVYDYANLHARLMKMADPARIALGHDLKGPNCSCDLSALTWARAIAKGEEMGNEHVRRVIEGGYKRFVDSLGESMKSWPAWAQKLGGAIGNGVKDIAQVFSYWREGLARWEMHKAVEDIDPQVRTLISRATSEGLAYKAALDRFKESLETAHGKEMAQKELERREFLLYRYWDDSGIMLAKSYEKSHTPREIEQEKARRMSLRQQAIESRLRKEAPELIPALDAVKTMLEIDASIFDMVRSKPGRYLLRMGGARSAIWAGRRLSRVYLDMAKRAMVGQPETAGLSMSRQNLGFFKTRKPNSNNDEGNVVPLFNSKGTIADRSLLGRALPLVSNYTINPKLAGAHMTAQLNYLVDRYGVNEKDLTDEMKGSTRFGRPMYVRIGDPSGTASTADIWYQNFDEARTPAYVRRSRAAVQEIKRMYMDDRYQYTRRKQLNVINERRKAQGKPPLALKSADKRRDQPIGGRKSDVAKLIKRLRTVYLPRDLALEIEDQVLLQSGYYRSNMLHKFGALWASSKTVGRPRHYVATWLSMMALNHMHGGMPLTFFPGYWKSAMREIKDGRGKYYDEIRNRLPASELADSDMSASILQIVDAMPMMTPWAIDSGKSLSQIAELGWRIGGHDWTARRVLAAGKAAQEKAFSFYRHMELAGKMALYRYLREDGMPVEEAWSKATLATIDPTTTPAALRHVSRGILGGFDSRGVLQAKFMTWRLRVLPTVVEAAWQRPLSMMRLALMMGLATSAAAAMSGWTDEESQDVMAAMRRERGLVAGTISGATNLPIGKSDAGRLRSLDLWNVIPFQDVMLAGGMPSIQPLQTAVELLAGRTFGMYPRELRPEGSYLGEQVLAHADHLFGQITPLYNEAQTILGPRSIKQQWRPDLMPGLDEQGPSRVFWDTVKAGALPVRTWTPSLSLGLDEDYRKAQEDVGFASERSKLTGAGAKNGHMFRRLASVARDQGLEAALEIVKGMGQNEQRYVLSNLRELAFYGSGSEAAKRYIAFAGFSADDFMTGVMKGEHWTSEDIPYLRMIAAIKAENSDTVDPDLYKEFLDWIGRVAWK